MYFEIDRKYPHSCINFVQIWLTALHQPWDTNFSIVSFRLFSKKIDRIVFMYHSFHFFNLAFWWDCDLRKMAALFHISNVQADTTSFKDFW